MTLQRMKQGRSTPHAAVQDHCHECGQDRSIICSLCNTRLRAYEYDTARDLAHRRKIQGDAPWFGSHARRYLEQHWARCAAKQQPRNSMAAQYRRQQDDWLATLSDARVLWLLGAPVP